MIAKHSTSLKVVVCLFLLLLLGPRGFAQATGPSVFINEIHYDNTGTDAGEFIEIAGPAGTDLSTYTIELYNGSGGARYDVDALAGVIPDLQNGFGTVSIAYPVNGIQNGPPDGIALVNGSSVIQFLSYEGSFTATSSTANEMTSTDIGVREDGSNALGTSLQLQGSGTTYDDFTWTATAIVNTRNAVNTGQIFSDDDLPPPPLLDIHEIQGSGGTSPYAGQRIETLDNIVTAKTSNGFFMQTPETRVDASGDTSEGIFVFTGAAPAVQVGNQVDVIGTVAEFFELTEIANGPTVTVDSSGHALPAPVMFGPSLPSPVPPGDLERLEGMLVRVENALVTGPTDGFGDTAVVAGATRAFREPGLEYPGIPGFPTWDGNPEIFEIDTNGAGLPAASFVAGAIIDVAEGPLSFAFGDYQIWATTLTPGAQPDVLRPVRARAAGELTIGSQNMLRLFDTTNDPGVSDPVATPAEFENRIAKASLYIRTVLGSPDVVVLEEVENLGVADALASRLVTDDPAAAYTAYLMEGHDIGGIDIGMLVRSTVAVSSVTQLGYSEQFEFNGNTNILHDRPPLVLQGNYIANGAPFPVTVIGVHNRSLSGIEGSDGPRIRAKRLAQALSMATYVQAIQESEPNRRIIVTGDFNAFQFSDGYVDALGVITGNLDPVGALLEGPDEVDPNLINQVTTLPAAEQYSYVFTGSAQVLDHTLTTANLQPFVRGFEYSRGSSDAPSSFMNDPSTPLGLSDHDGAVLFVMTDRDADGFADDADNCPASSKTVVMVGTCTTGVPDQILINGCSITDSIAAMAATSANHGAFVSQTTHWLSDLRKNGAIDNKQRGEIVSCAARSNVP